MLFTLRIERQLIIQQKKKKKKNKEKKDGHIITLIRFSSVYSFTLASAS